MYRQVGKEEADEGFPEELEMVEAEPATTTKQAESDSNLTPTSVAVHPPQNYFCPITLHLLEDPVTDSCGHCFERDAIEAWLQFHSLCPISRKPLRQEDLQEALALKLRIDTWKQEHRMSNPANLTLQDAMIGVEEAAPFVSTASVPHVTSATAMERFLLPQERRVVTLIQWRQRLRRSEQARRRCWISIAVASAIALAVFLRIKLY